MGFERREPWCSRTPELLKLRLSNVNVFERVCIQRVEERVVEVRGGLTSFKTQFNLIYLRIASTILVNGLLITESIFSFQIYTFTSLTTRASLREN